MDGPPPLRFSVGAERVLWGAGWAPERRVDPTAWLGGAHGGGLADLAAAEAVLANLGGLVVRPEPRWGTRLSPRRFALDPMTLSGEADRLPI